MFKIALIAVASFTLLVEATCPQNALDAIPEKEDFPSSSYPSLRKTVCKLFKSRFEDWNVTTPDVVDDCYEAFKTKTGLDSRLYRYLPLLYLNSWFKT